MGLAEDLGAEAVMLDGLRVRDEILAFARTRNVSRIVVGKLHRSRWRELVSGSLVGSLLHESGDVDLYVMRGEDHFSTSTTELRRRVRDEPRHAR